VKPRDFLIGLFVGGLAGACLGWFAAQTRPPFSMTDVEARVLADEAGNLIGAAIYSYRDARGNWPPDLDALVPDFLAVRPNLRWWLMVDGSRVILLGKTGWESDAIEFDFSRVDRGWWRNARRLERVGSPPRPNPTTAEEPGNLASTPTTASGL